MITRIAASPRTRFPSTLEARPGRRFRLATGERLGLLLASPLRALPGILLTEVRPPEWPATPPEGDSGGDAAPGATAGISRVPERSSRGGSACSFTSTT